MSTPRAAVRLAAVALSAGLLSACSGVPGLYTVEGEGQSLGPEKFNATTYVDGIWQDKVLAGLDANADDAGPVLTALAADPDAAAQEFGIQSGTGAAATYAVKGTATVEDVDAASAVGRIRLKVPGAPAKTEVFMAVGPAFVGTALRDAAGIGFSGFTNQLDYADVATALNTKVRTTVLNGVDAASLKGKTITFEGAFAALDPSAVVITPAELTVAP